jgi:hypothetical protein
MGQYFKVGGVFGGGGGAVGGGVGVVWWWWWWGGGWEAFDLAQQICVEMGQYFQLGGFARGVLAGGWHVLCWLLRSRC